MKRMLLKLKEKIEERKAYIEKSKKFESREYNNLTFLKKVSSMLREGAPFQVDSLEYGPERFSLSGTIVINPRFCLDCFSADTFLSNITAWN